MRGRDWLAPVLASYSQVLFGRSLWVGTALLLATLTAPSVGGMGLLGVLASLGAAAAFGVEEESRRAGSWSYNGLLIGLAMGAYYAPSPMLALLVGLAAAASVGVQVAVGGWLRAALGLPVLSLPFVLVGWVALTGMPFLRGLTPRAAPADTLVSLPPLGVLDAFGDVLTTPNALAGGIILAALLAWSRVAAVHALVGVAAAALVQAALLDFPLGVDPLLLSYNSLLTAVLLGGVLLVPSGSSLALAGLASLLCGALTVGLARPLTATGLPALALPFNLVSLVTLYALAWRRPDAWPRLATLHGASPEDTLHRFQSRLQRFGVVVPLRLRLPFRGAWVCTQGNDGPHTHQGIWRHGLDFEVQDAEGQRFKRDGKSDGKKLTDWYCYGLPVCAMAPGTVVEIVDGLPDNPIGEIDAVNPWGNAVVIQHAPGLFSVVAHLQPRSLRVRKGDVVSEGQELGRCGSSGRSPVPHLHVQLQPSAAVGDRTLPIAFHGVVTQADNVVHAEICPKEGDVLSNVSTDAALARALSLPPQRSLRTTLTSPPGTTPGTTSGTSPREEVLVSEIDPAGGRSLVSATTGARLWFESREDTFVVYDYQGPADSALFVLAVALSRVPLGGAGLSWRDAIDARRFDRTPLQALTRAVTDLAAVVRPPPMVPVAYTLTEQEGTPVVEGKAQLAGGVSLSTRAVLSRKTGLSHLSLTLGPLSWEVVCHP